MILLFVVLVFLAVVLAGIGFVLHRDGALARALRERLDDLRPSAAPADAREMLRDQRLSTLPWFDAALRRLSLGQHLELLLYQAGTSMRAGVLVLLIASCGMAGYMVGLLASHRVGPALLLMAIAAPMPYLWVRHRKARRMAQFAREFPDALDLLVSALRAGLSFAAAMQIVAEESPDPVGGEFAITVEEQALGIDFREALAHMTRRVDSPDLGIFVTALVLQRETGGNLAEILENTATLIRDRFRILGDVRTFTAQGRMTGTVLMFLPLGISLFALVVAPEFIRPMFETGGGRLALWVAGGLQLLGIFSIRRIVDIKV